MTTALFMLRCVQLGLSIQDLDLLTIGMVEEMMMIWTNSDVPKTDKRAYMDNEISTIVESWYAWMCF